MTYFRREGSVGGYGCGAIVAVLVFLAVIYGAAFAALRDETEHGKCLGLNGEKDPGLKYTYSTRNIVIGAVTFQSVVLPIYVALERLQCPTAKADSSAVKP